MRRWHQTEGGSCTLAHSDCSSHSRRVGLQVLLAARVEDCRLLAARVPLEAKIVNEGVGYVLHGRCKAQDMLQAYRGCRYAHSSSMDHSTGAEGSAAAQTGRPA